MHQLYRWKHAKQSFLRSELNEKEERLYYELEVKLHWLWWALLQLNADSQPNLQSYVVLHHYNVFIKPQTVYSECIAKQMRLYNLYTQYRGLVTESAKHPLLRWSEINTNIHLHRHKRSSEPDRLNPTLLDTKLKYKLDIFLFSWLWGNQSSFFCPCFNCSRFTGATWEYILWDKRLFCKPIPGTFTAPSRFCSADTMTRLVPHGLWLLRELFLLFFLNQCCAVLCLCKCSECYLLVLLILPKWALDSLQRISVATLACTSLANSLD